MNDNTGIITSDDRAEEKTRAQTALLKAKQKDKGKIAVRVGDKVNTILIVHPKRKKTAVKDFLEKTKTR